MGAAPNESRPARPWCPRGSFCFTLWCSAHGGTFSSQIDHDSLDSMTVAHDAADAAKIGIGWRNRSRMPLPFTPQLPAALRGFFLSEMRGWLVRCFARDAEIGAVLESHYGEKRREMVEGITAHHDKIRSDNPRWLIDLVRPPPPASRRSPPLPLPAAAAARRCRCRCPPLPGRPHPRATTSKLAPPTQPPVTISPPCRSSSCPMRRRCQRHRRSIRWVREVSRSGAEAASELLPIRRRVRREVRSWQKEAMWYRSRSCSSSSTGCVPGGSERRFMRFHIC